MKHAVKYAFAALPLAILLAGPAQADTLGSDWYAGLSGDLTWMSHADTGYGGNAQLGYRFQPSSFGTPRLEGEFGYHHAHGSNGFDSTHYFTYMANAYYDFNLSHMSSALPTLTPYIGAGLGDATIHFGNGQHDNAFAYQFMAGLEIIPDSTPQTEWYLGYRYQGSDKIHDERLKANSLELGVRFHF